MEGTANAKGDDGMLLSRTRNPTDFPPFLSYEMSQITDVFDSSFASGKKLLGRKNKDTDQLSGDHA